MRQGDLIKWYIEQQNAAGVFSSLEEVVEEYKCLRAIIERLIKNEGHLIVIDDGGSTAETAVAEESEETRSSAIDNRILTVNPNFVIE
ncbi:unnamed protein product [Victoria cruziana]